METMNENFDDESLSQELSVSKIPNCLYCIFMTVFWERFHFHGLQTSFALYLINELHFSRDKTEICFYAWLLTTYLCPIIGATLADSWFGKFNTIIYLSILYSVGSIVLCVGSFPNKLQLMEILSLVSLFIIAIGTGGIKPLLTVFGADQYDHDQEESRKYFFSIMYFMKNCGGLLSVIITPILRAEVSCLGSNQCFPLSFSVSATLLIIAFVIFTIGKHQYKIRTPKQNVLALSVCCIAHALVEKFRRKERDKEHWLDYAEDKYEKNFIQDVKMVLRVWFVMIPVPVFWFFFYHMVSRWIKQAEKLDTKIGSMKIRPEQLQIINPILIVVLIPLFDGIIYPVSAEKRFLIKPLQRLIVGGLFGVLALIAAGLVEHKLENSTPGSVYAKIIDVNILNDSLCLNIIRGLKNESIDQFQARETLFGDFENSPYLAPFTVKELNGTRELFFTNNILDIKNIKSSPFKIKYSTVLQSEMPDSLHRIMNDKGYQISLNNLERVINCESISNISFSIFISKPQNLSQITIFQDTDLMNDEVHSLSSETDIEESDMFMGLNATAESKFPVSILYQLPQYILMTISEVMFAITGLYFSYSQAPQSMKAVMQASWLVIVALGNILTIIVGDSHMLEKQSSEFFIFAAILFLDIVLLAILTFFYEYRVQEDPSEEEIQKEP